MHRSITGVTFEQLVSTARQSSSGSHLNAYTRKLLPCEWHTDIQMLQALKTVDIEQSHIYRKGYVTRGTFLKLGKTTTLEISFRLDTL
jgi:hypothetical protein